MADFCSLLRRAATAGEPPGERTTRPPARPPEWPIPALAALGEAPGPSPFEHYIDAADQGLNVAGFGGSLLEPMAGFGGDLGKALGMWTGPLGIIADGASAASNIGELADGHFDEVEDPMAALDIAASGASMTGNAVGLAGLAGAVAEGGTAQAVGSLAGSFGFGWSLGRFLDGQFGWSDMWADDMAEVLPGEDLDRMVALEGLADGGDEQAARLLHAIELQGQYLDRGSAIMLDETGTPDGDMGDSELRSHGREAIQREEIARLVAGGQDPFSAVADVTARFPSGGDLEDTREREEEVLEARLAVYRGERAEGLEGDYVARGGAEMGLGVLDPAVADLLVDREARAEAGRDALYEEAFAEEAAGVSPGDLRAYLAAIERAERRVPTLDTLEDWRDEAEDGRETLADR